MSLRSSRSPFGPNEFTRLFQKQREAIQKRECLRCGGKLVRTERPSFLLNTKYYRWVCSKCGDYIDE